MADRPEAEVMRDAYSPEHMLLRAPVQGYPGGIPWPIHLEAYAAYCKRYYKQVALIDLEGRGCRGGFGDTELDSLIPGWRERVSPIAEMQHQLVAIRKACDLHDHPTCRLIDEIRKILGADTAIDGFHSCDQACCEKRPGEYCKDDNCNCGAAGGHATLPQSESL